MLTHTHSVLERVLFIFNLDSRSKNVPKRKQVSCVYWCIILLNLWIIFVIFIRPLSIYERTIEDVKKVIEHAKLSENDLKPNVQSLYFGDKFESYKLLELDDHILADLKCGQTLVFFICVYNYSYFLRYLKE